MSEARELELAIWFDGAECTNPVVMAGDQIKEAVDLFCRGKNVTCLGIAYDILSPGDDRVPEVPHWLEQVNGVMPKLLLATITVVPKQRIKRSKGIIADLDRKDVTRLRSIVRRSQRAAQPGARRLSDRQCDEIIDSLGMEVVMDQLRSSVVH